MLKYLIKKIFGVTIVMTAGKSSDRMETFIRHREKVSLETKGKPKTKT